MEIAFYGAAQMVTGSKHLLTLPSGKKLLMDCGMFQGRGAKTNEMNQHFGFAPSEVDYLILSHAHIDHSGLIPRLVKEGFRGIIYATSATFNLCKIMLLDSAHIQENDAVHINKKLKAKGKALIDPLYTQDDVAPALELFETVAYNKPFAISKEVTLTLTDAGHMLGSACVNLTITDGQTSTNLTYTGDIGRYCNRLLKDPQPFPQADVIICESTYGDRLHDENDNVEVMLLEIVKRTCVDQGGKLIIPAFSVGRTQEVVHVLNKLEHEGKLPAIDVFVDSPMATNATEVMRQHRECFNERVNKLIQTDPTPFGFEKLRYTRDVSESIALNTRKDPCIIISASGMIEAGRIKHHLLYNIEDPNSTILLIGWATPSSLGGRLRAGEKVVPIFGDYYHVNASIEIIDAFSAHGDYKDMLRFLSCQDADKVKQVYLVHGDDEVMPLWREKLVNAEFKNVVIPDWKTEHTIS